MTVDYVRVVGGWNESSPAKLEEVCNRVIEAESDSDCVGVEFGATAMSPSLACFAILSFKRRTRI
jgi:hypothetical protein